MIFDVQLLIKWLYVSLQMTSSATNVINVYNWISY